jgi:hypothetical protein
MVRSATAPFGKLVAADVWRCTGQRGWRAFVKAWLTDPLFRPVFTMRLCQACQHLPSGVRGPVVVLTRWWHQRTRMACALDIPWSLPTGLDFKLIGNPARVLLRTATPKGYFSLPPDLR